jgi:hypothetical protein
MGECEFSVSVGNMTELRGCRAGGACGRAGWSGPFTECKTYKEIVKNEKV